MMTYRSLWLLLIAALLLPGAVFAQDDADESDTAEIADEDLPEIPYFRSTTGFNVPVPQAEGWENRSTPDTAVFVNDDLQAEIVVTQIAGDDRAEAIRQALADRLDLALEAPVYTDTVNLADGTWQQAVYQAGDVTASALGKIDAGRAYVVAFIERNPDADTYQLIVRGAEPGDLEAEVDPLAAIETAITTLLDPEFDVPPDDSETADLFRRTWEVAHYDAAGLTGFGFVFGSVTFTAITDGDADAKLGLADTFNTVFLGFFITPDNSPYLWLGYALSAAILAFLIGSFILRSRSADRDIQTIEELND